MKPNVCFLLPVLWSAPMQAGKWPPIPPEVWALKSDPAVAAKGAVVLERKLDFQPGWIDTTVRVRIVGEAGLAAAEIRDLPELVLSMDVQVTYPDGRVQAVGKRKDMLVRKVVSAEDGVTLEEALVPPGVTADCVVDMAWREQTAYGQAVQIRKPLTGVGYLPKRCGNFWWWSLGSPYPTRAAVVQRSKEFYWSLSLSSAGGQEMEEGSTSMGYTYTFRDLPAFTPAPFATLGLRPAPKVVVCRPIPSVSYLQHEASVSDYWDKVTELYYQDWFLKFLTKGEPYQRFSAALREGLTGGPRARAKAIAERLNRRTRNLDQLNHGEKAGFFDRSSMDGGKLALGSARFYDPMDSFSAESYATGAMMPDGYGMIPKYTMDDNRVSTLNYMAKTGVVDNKGITRLLFCLLVDEGIPVQVGLVSDRRRWAMDPDLRTPFQFTQTLLGVAEPGQPELWLDPTNRMLPPGEVSLQFQGTKALIIDAATWKTRIGEIPFDPAEVSRRSHVIQMDATGREAKVNLEARFTGSSAFLARNLLGPKSPAERDEWVKQGVEKAGLAVTRAAVADALDLAKPLAVSAEGTLPLDPGATLTCRLFPGLVSDLYLPTALPEPREEPVLLPYRGIQEATSTVQVPKGYVLAKPVQSSEETPWGKVLLEVRQDPATGVVTARFEAWTLRNLGREDTGLKSHLDLVRNAIFAKVTLEKTAAGAGS